MPIYRPGYVMAAIYEDDESGLMPLERLIYRIICALGPYKRAVRERWLYARRETIRMHKEHGINDFIVPGAGIPTAGHVHEVLSSARVLYIDKDSTIVREANKLIGENPNVCYIQGDLRRWDEIVHRCREFFGPSPKVGVVFIGSTYFIPDSDLRNFFSNLYEFAGPGSRMLVDNINAEIPKPPAHHLAWNLYRLSGNRLYARSDEEFRSILSPWRVDEVEPIFYAVPTGFTIKIKLYEELTEEEKKLPPGIVSYKAVKD